NNNNNSNNNNNKQEEKKSSDSTLKSLNVEGYNLVRVDDNNYTLSVRNEISSININAAANDLKAKVEGTGLYELVEGENPITITVTAENGSKNVINIVITRELKEEKEIIPVNPEKKETPKKDTKKKINITLKDYLLFGSLLLNVLLIVAIILINIKYRALKEASKNMVYDSKDLPFGFLNENGK
ncbi:MAG: cadherin-like beta sandwich domain-containing protein, partial [Bacilli bacterium]|nr:cadherin-like beta sandwich domain-containing protein [Bacilli bacterium]